MHKKVQQFFLYANNWRMKSSLVATYSPILNIGQLHMFRSVLEPTPPESGLKRDARWAKEYLEDLTILRVRKS